MKVWTLVKKWDRYEDQNWMVMGVFDGFDKAVSASDADLKENSNYKAHEWELESDDTHNRYFDYVYISGYHGGEETDSDYGYYEITEMDVQ